MFLRALFDHVDRAGGASSPAELGGGPLHVHRRAIFHFDDVSYLHQHLVMNLPATPPPDLTPTPPRDLAATSLDLPAPDEASSSCGKNKRQKKLQLAS